MKRYRLPDKKELEDAKISPEIAAAYSREMFSKRDYAERLPFYYSDEKAVMQLVKTGNIQAVEEYFNSVNTEISIGNLSGDELRHAKYTFVAAITICTRSAIEGGMAELDAYTLSDVYIKKCDELESTEKIRSLFISAIKDFTLKVDRSRSRRPYPARVSRALRFIADRLHERITLEEIAEHCSLTPRYMSKLFEEAVGVSPVEYVRARKLEIAADMLSLSDKPLIDISNALGFCSPSAFGAAFKAHYGVSPKAYRDIHTNK